VIYTQRRDRIRPAHRSLSRQKLTGLVCFEAFGAATPKALPFATTDRQDRACLIELLTRSYELLEQGAFFARLAFFLITLATLGFLAHTASGITLCIALYESY
jgi:hypothetical protein